MKLRLRALEPSDLEMMYDTENDKSLWVYSNTSSPFSKHTLKKFIENSHLDIIEHKQVRLVIFDESNSYGFIDLLIMTTLAEGQELELLYLRSLDLKV